MPQNNNNRPNKKKPALDLIDGKPAKKRGQQKGKPGHYKKNINQQKREALDIFQEDGKKKTSQVVNKVADQAPAEEPKEDSKIVSLKPPIVVGDLAEKIGLKPFQLMADLIKLEVFVAPTQAIEPDIAAVICDKYGFKFEREKRQKGAGVTKQSDKVKEPKKVVEKDEGKLELRSPIITFMGHVDHGKTTMLDFYRESRITAAEAGGITQGIGAYKVEHNGKPVTFLDTPGHAIFSGMRKRGAAITDIVVLVVAADDGIMPQTKEAIKHAKDAGKTIIIAINKCDAPGADPMRVMGQLMENDLTPVDFGGDIECIQVSALKGDGMEDLLELLALQAEVLELKANPKATARAFVIEAEIKEGRGPTATVIVEDGTLKQGTPFICGPYAGKVKGMVNDKGERIKSALPGSPVEVLGFNELPNVGDDLVEMKNDREAKKLSEERLGEQRMSRLATPQKMRLEDLMATAYEGGDKPTLKIILKTDVQGSVQAITGAIEDIETDKVDVQFVTAAAGAITETDVVMAASGEDAVIIGFNTKVDAKAARAAKKEGVQIKLYSIVYELIDQVRDAMEGMLEPEVRETVIGHATVKMVFKVHKGKAAGSYVEEGKVTRTAHARVLRDGVPVFDGKMSTLRRYQEEVEEIKFGTECGIRLGDYDDYEENDVIECYILEKIDQEL